MIAAASSSPTPASSSSARTPVEQQLITGRAFKNNQGTQQAWLLPSTGAPDGRFAP